MELGVPASRSNALVRRPAPLVAGAALAGAAAFIAANDPAAPGSVFPGCILHQATGLWCPACGLTRGVHQLLHGHVGSAIGYNVFAPVVVVAIAGAWLMWLRVSWGASAIHIGRRTWRAIAIVVPVVVLAFGVLRNVPVQPLRALAP